jgi:hypothetical protein
VSKRSLAPISGVLVFLLILSASVGSGLAHAHCPSGAPLSEEPLDGPTDLLFKSEIVIGLEKSVPVSNRTDQEPTARRTVPPTCATLCSFLL